MKWSNKTNFMACKRDSSRRLLELLYFTTWSLALSNERQWIFPVFIHHSECQKRIDCTSIFFCILTHPSSLLFLAIACIVTIIHLRIHLNHFRLLHSFAFIHLTLKSLLQPNFITFCFSSIKSWIIFYSIIFRIYPSAKKNLNFNRGGGEMGTVLRTNKNVLFLLVMLSLEVIVGLLQLTTTWLPTLRSVEKQ